MLLPQDVLVLLKLAVSPGKYTYASLSHSLDISSSQAHSAIKRCIRSGLVEKGTMRLNRAALTEFVIHGVKYAYPAVTGPIQRGMPTLHTALPLSEYFPPAVDPVVWPDPAGEVRGETLLPLYKTVPSAARKDLQLYKALVLIDAVRAGRARERQIAEELIIKMLDNGEV